MAKYVIETIQIVKRKYYVEVDNPEWAHDGIVMCELDEFSQQLMTEEIWGTTLVDEFPRAEKFDSVNAATMKFNYNLDEWQSETRWDLDYDDSM